MSADTWEERLKAVMRRGGLRPADLAVLLAVPPSTLHYWLRGNVKPEGRRYGGQQQKQVDAALKGIITACRERRLPIDPTLPVDKMKGALIAIRNEYIVPDSVF